jgi:TatD DNase family protein
MIDSHCHLADDVFAADLEAVVGRARAAGVEGALVILEGGNASEAGQARKLDALWPAARMSVGVHPHVAHAFADDPARASDIVRAQIADTPPVRAVGEIGLDYHYDHSPRDVQKAVFRSQLQLARDLGLPVVIHTREADDDTLSLLRAEGAGVSGVLHCFTGPRSLAEAALDLGFYVSFAGIVTFPKAVELREVARTVPLDRLLVETGSPFLAPVPHRGKRNEPALVADVVKRLAELRDMQPDELANRTTANFHRLFGP